MRADLPAVSTTRSLPSTRTRVLSGSSGVPNPPSVVVNLISRSWTNRALATTCSATRCRASRVATNTSKSPVGSGAVGIRLSSVAKFSVGRAEGPRRTSTPRDNSADKGDDGAVDDEPRCTPRRPTGTGDRALLGQVGDIGEARDLPGSLTGRPLGQ